MFSMMIHSFRKKHKVKKALTSSEFDLLLSFLKENGGNHASHLIFLQDKELFWTKDRNMLFVYKRFANKLVVLGDPIGEELNL
ncbi:phosphatidylglycerol lysyltransferase domain-containing protein [Bacillus dakarensis]|uniref:phosphatidylglycerol lysyltransferase domain-containing protein n=1 Tax=Robertmurraya dakarensis TaxID=1926278 RepID=UPI0009812051|nr:phosphatidylglycerol lysyltransferase domain-containing protein [Bacillus dakarensis]